MSDCCPHCDDLSIDASRARRMEKRKAPEKPGGNGSGPKQGHGTTRNKIKINVDSSGENADRVKRVRDGSDKKSRSEDSPSPGVPLRRGRLSVRGEPTVVLPSVL